MAYTHSKVRDVAALFIIYANNCFKFSAAPNSGRHALISNAGDFGALSTRLMILFCDFAFRRCLNSQKTRCDIKDVSLVNDVSLLTYSVM